MRLGDFNGHHKKWDGRDMNPRSRIIEDFLSDGNLCILNDDAITYLHPAYHAKARRTISEAKCQF